MQNWRLVEFSANIRACRRKFNQYLLESERSMAETGKIVVNIRILLIHIGSYRFKSKPRTAEHRVVSREDAEGVLCKL